MRILVLGAGAVGGYFGGRMAEAGLDVTFLVRPARRARLAADGLTVTSNYGSDFAIPVTALTREEIDRPYDLVLLSCKAYDLGDAMDAIAPAMGPDSTVLPVLNGLRHIEELQARFGAGNVLGGICYVGAALDAETGHIRHFGDFHRIVCGELDGATTPRSEALTALNGKVGFDLDVVPDVMQAMWDKFAMQAALSCANVITRATVGEILEARSGEAFLLAALAECRDAAAGLGHPISAKTLALYDHMFTERGSTFATSTLRDVEAGRRTEGEHIIGDLARRAEDAGLEVPILRCARTALETYEAKLAAS